MTTSSLSLNHIIDNGISHFQLLEIHWMVWKLCMIQKGQIRNIGKDIVKQNQFIRGLFGLAA